MKPCKEKDYRCFYHFGEAYYYKSGGLSFDRGVKDQISFGLSCGGGGTHGEMIMEFSELGGKIIPQLKVYDDAWGILASFTDLLAEMSKAVAVSIHDKSITPKQFCEMLLRCGFKDNTPYINPHPHLAKEISYTPSREELEQALSSIARLWPIETTVKLGEVSGINDGRSRAILAEEAVTIARKALGIEKQP